MDAFIHSFVFLTLVVGVNETLDPYKVPASLQGTTKPSSNTIECFYIYS